jgi:hypothetical protein
VVQTANAIRLTGQRIDAQCIIGTSMRERGEMYERSKISYNSVSYHVDINYGS